MHIWCEITFLLLCIELKMAAMANIYLFPRIYMLYNSYLLHH